MPFSAQIYRIFIASPSDVEKERNAVREVIEEWNIVNASSKQVVLLPIGWETHSVPQMGERPQEHINNKVLKDADILVAIFWKRLGGDAGKGVTGTEEEIQEHLDAGKPARIYFSKKNVPHATDVEQLSAVKAFQKTIAIERKGQYAEFKSVVEFKSSFRRHLDITMNELLAGKPQAVAAEQSHRLEPVRNTPQPSTTPDAAPSARTLDARPIRSAESAPIADEEEIVTLSFTACSYRMRRDDGDRRSINITWKELFVLLVPMISAGKFRDELKHGVEMELLRRLVNSGGISRYGTDYNSVNLLASDFDKIAYQFEQLNYITQSAVGFEFTERGRNRARQWATLRSQTPPPRP